MPTFDDQRSWRIVLIASALITLARLAVLVVSPLELYPDEAQYWLWSRELAFGYFSKPPMVAWLIAATTALGGDAEPFVRASSPLLHAVAGILAFAVGRRLYDARAGLAAFAIYTLAPGVALSAFVVSTDAALLACLMLSLWFYVRLQAAAGRRRLLAAAGFGLAVGLAFLAKYAAVYILAGVALHLALDKAARQAWSLGAALLALAVLAAVMAPNLAWNASHGFATLAHTAGNADWGAEGGLTPIRALQFIGAQFGVFGPLPFAVLIGGAVWLAIRRRLQRPDVLLLCFALPPLAIICGQAFISRANANWAAAAYGPGAVLVAGWLVRWRAWRWFGWGLGLQGVLVALAMLVMVDPHAADRVGASNSLKRVRGWRAMTSAVIERAKTEETAAPLSAIAVDDRFAFNSLAYYGRDYFGRDGPPLRIWREGPARSQAEMEASLKVAEAGRVLAVTLDGRATTALARRFASLKGRQILTIWLDPKHKRVAEVLLAEGLRPPERSGSPLPSSP
jgi:4-amino-4-deoxy-L-arabinose transferase-like glycosyltransferase